MEKIKSSDPQVHARYIAKHVHELRQHCRDDIKDVEDPRAKALFETMAEVLGGLEKALSDFQSESEPSWRQ
jgi:hypothetical protein